MCVREIELSRGSRFARISYPTFDSGISRFTCQRSQFTVSTIFFFFRAAPLSADVNNCSQRINDRTTSSKLNRSVFMPLALILVIFNHVYCLKFASE